jgi:putative endonuclease
VNINRDYPPINSNKPSGKLDDVSISNAWRMPTYEKGISAESCASKRLEADGYKIIGRRVRTKYGEIDILAKRGNDLVAVEVKQRKSLDSARACIAQRQRRRISNAMLAVISERDELFENYRVDVICFDTVGRFEHIENAFPIEEFCCC